MAIAATTVYEVRPTNGVDTNGGGYVPGSSGSDFSQQNAAQYALTGLTSAAANAIILTASAASDMVGNIIQIISGTNFTAGFYQILSVSVGVSITVDRNCTTAAGATGVANIGGALKTLGKVHTLLTTANQNATGQTVWVKAEATITVGAVTNLSPNGGTNLQATQINGYTTTRGDNGQVTIQATSGTGFTLLNMQVTGPVIIRNFIIDGNSRGTVKGVTLLGSYVRCENFLVENCPSGGIEFNNTNNQAYRCTVTACGTFGFHMEQGNGPNTAIECVAYANTASGFIGEDFIAIRCISANNTGGTSDGFGSANGLAHNVPYMILDHCFAYTNGRHGFNFSNGFVCLVHLNNCISWGNASKDLNFPGTWTGGGITNDYNFYATNTGYVAGAHDVVLTGDPTVAGASNNFALNNTAGAGAACRAAGFPGVMAVGGTGYIDGGPLQHADPLKLRRAPSMTGGMG